MEHLVIIGKILLNTIQEIDGKNGKFYKFKISSLDMREREVNMILFDKNIIEKCFNEKILSSGDTVIIIAKNTKAVNKEGQIYFNFHVKHIEIINKSISDHDNFLNELKEFDKLS